MINSAIEIKEVSKKFGNFKALDNVSLVINENRCVGVLGPNGAGKTTLIKILTKLVRPSEGSVFVNGIDLSRNPKMALSKIGAVVETPEFYSTMTPYEILFFFGSLRGIPKQILDERIFKTLQMVGLDQWIRKKIRTFSKGMKQRLALASSLIHDPSILILDEPTSGLDPRGSMEIRRIIQELKTKGKTIFISSHILSEVQEICDEIALIDKGKLIQHLEISDFKAKYSKIDISFLQKIEDSILAKILKIEGVKSAENKGNKVLLTFSGGKNERAELLKELQKIGLDLISFNPSNELESLYMDNISESVR